MTKKDRNRKEHRKIIFGGKKKEVKTNEIDQLQKRHKKRDEEKMEKMRSRNKRWTQGR